MNKENSVIGCGYIPRGSLAVCLKTNANTRLGEVVYKIIKDPYERVFERQEIFAMTPRCQKRMAVNVLDANTGLTYAVEYEPENLVRTTPESGADKQGEPCDFATRAEQIAGEFKVMFDPAGEGSPTSAVLHSMQFRTTGIMKHRRVCVFSAVEVTGSQKLLRRHVPGTPKPSKS